jgi:hypothetical protein
VTEPTTPTGSEEPQDAAYWAQLTSVLRVSRTPTGALNLNVEGRRVVGPLQGFGQMWQKTYSMRLPEVALTPAEVVQIWKENFVHFQPPSNHFYAGKTVVKPGDVLLINTELSGMPLSTGVMVLYADNESFTLMTPQGHPESGWVTFSAYSEDDCTVCQVQSIARANDPLYELGFRLFGSTIQERIWVYVLEALAAHLHQSEKVQIARICIDQHVQWSEARNIWHNAALRTVIYTLSAPLRWIRHSLGR